MSRRPGHGFAAPSLRSIERIPTLAVEQFEHAMRLSPFDPTGYMCLENAACTYSLETRPCEAPEPWCHCGTFRLRQECADDETAGRRCMPKWAKGSPQSPATMAETT